MSTLTPQRLRRIALISLLVGVVVLVTFVVGSWATSFIHDWDDANIGLAFLLFFAAVLACGCIVYAGNALAWSAIVPRLPSDTRKRSYVVTAIIFGFVVVSIFATFFLVLGSFYVQL